MSNSVGPTLLMPASIEWQLTQVLSKMTLPAPASAAFAATPSTRLIVITAPPAATFAFIVDSLLSGGSLVLHRVEIGKDVDEVLLLEDVLPRRHALGRPAVGDGREEHLLHLIAVLLLQPPQIDLAIGNHGIGPVAM